ncbi:carbohydrate ABC transporter permease, partial [Streptomyces sp. SID5910]|nr:carbohydrate ABC transporter permease [Streptomyces sp. SID5910]
MKTTETPAPVPAGPGPVVRKTETPPGGLTKGKKEGTTLNVFSHGVLVIWAIMVGMPLVWAVMTSFKDDASIFGSPWSLPDKLNFDNWSRAWSQAHMGDYFLNTVLVVGGSLVGTLVLGSMAAYVLARFD